MKVLEARTCAEIDYAQEAENSLLQSDPRMVIPVMPSGAPYAIDDEVWVQDGSDRYVLATVEGRSHEHGAAFGLVWLLLVSITGPHGTRMTRVRCDDNGRNRTRTHGVMPS